MTKIPKAGQLAKLIFDDKSSNYEAVAKIIQSNEFITQKEIAEATSLSKATISRILTSLRSEGLIILIKKKKGRQSLYRWVGGTSAVEAELQEATTKHITASLLAETYDSLVTDAFSLFSVLFESHGWEVVVNIKEGLTDTEIHQFLGNDVSLDSIRRILVTCDAHNLIKLNRIRSPAGSEVIKLFDPLYRIDYINKEFLDLLILIRGLASAARFEIENKHKEGYIHPFGALLNLNKNLYSSFLKDAFSSSNDAERELLDKVLCKGYDFVPDFDRIYRSENWRNKLRESNDIVKDDISDTILVTNNFAKRCMASAIKELSDSNE